MTTRRYRAWVAVCVNVVVLSASACSSDDGGMTCNKLCGDLCSAAADCPGAQVSSSCAADCKIQRTPASCENWPPHLRLSCDELKATVACTAYCASVCQRATECGSFDKSLCATGCRSVGPPLCNAASIAPRSCDELESELQIYQQAGRAQKTGDTFATSSDFQTGVCTQQFECSGGILCDLTTNVCSKCNSNADCAPLGASELCAPEGICVECVVDSDCTLPTHSKCKPDNHRCVQCSTDADCPTYFPHCGTSTGACGP